MRQGQHGLVKGRGMRQGQHGIVKGRGGAGREAGPVGQQGAFKGRGGGGREAGPGGEHIVKLYYKFRRAAYLVVLCRSAVWRKPSVGQIRLEGHRSYCLIRLS